MAAFRAFSVRSLRGFLDTSLRRRAQTSRNLLRGRRPRIEPLEDRRVLAISAPTLESDGDLVINGSMADDSVVVSYNQQGDVVVNHEAGGESRRSEFAVDDIRRIVFVAGKGDDYFQMHVGLNTLARMAGGDDTVVGGKGRDLIFGGDGNDLLIGGGGADELHGEGGNDMIFGVAGADLLVGGHGNDYLNAGDGDDELHGQVGDDLLEGGNGNDRLQAGDGNDSAFGGAGDDRLDGGAGNDVLNGDVGDDEVYGGAGHDALYGHIGNDNLVDGAGNDRLFGGDGDDTLFGGVGDDMLDGGAGHDVLHEHIGHGILLGGHGDDALYGGDGNDLLAGHEGDDLLYGESGDDTLVGLAGDDQLVGDWGNDAFFGGTGADTLIGGVGEDVLHGEEGDDTLLGGHGDDVLLGGSGADRLLGDDGADLLSGADNGDSLDGGAGRDVLIGGRGVDELSGGSGGDVLLGGVAAFDGNVELLVALRDEWNRNAPYATLTARISSPAFAASLRLGVTAGDDGVADSILGGGALDWYFRTGALSTYDPLGRAGMGPNVVSTLPALEGFDFIRSLDDLRDRQSSERLQTLIPHGADALRQDEHLALNQLVRYDQVTHYAVRDGDWSDPGTWRNGVLPTTRSRVLIPIGLAVRVDAEIAQRLDTIRIDGTLTYATDRDAELIVDTAVVTATGALVIGTESAPVHRSARLTFSGVDAIDPASDPYLIGKGLISHGSVSIHGSKVAASAEAAEVRKGQNWIRLAGMPEGWREGHRVVVASTNPGVEQNEERVIVAMYGDVIVLDRPLDHDHGATAGDLPVTIANLTRNVVISSESGEINRRGHVMFMHNRNVAIRNAEFYRLGRTDKMTPINDPHVDAEFNLVEGTGTNPRARYPVHFHRNGTVNNGASSVVSGSVVHDAPGWGYVNHSSYVDFFQNVGFDIGGAAFATEVGDEIGSFIGNIAIGSYGSSELTEDRVRIQDFGHEGDGFWLQGFGVSVVGNTSAGHDGNGFAFYGRSLRDGGIDREFLASNLVDPSIANGKETVPVGAVPALAFFGNSASASNVGLLIQYHLEVAEHDHVGVFSDSILSNNYTGVSLPYSNQVVLRDLVVAREVSEGLDDRPRYGITGNGITQNVRFENLTVSGYYFGIDAPRSGVSVISGGSFDNWNNIFVRPGLTPGRKLLVTGDIHFNGFTSTHLIADYRVFAFRDSVSQIFSQDTITLDYGSFNNQRAYFYDQARKSVPFPKAFDGLDTSYAGLTGAELWSRYRVAVGGGLAPPGAREVAGVWGLVAPT